METNANKAKTKPCGKIEAKNLLVHARNTLSDDKTSCKLIKGLREEEEKLYH
jgi:cellobiose-specific phosphotransferase system component IIA